jgi:hypothetical protein
LAKDNSWQQLMVSQFTEAKKPVAMISLGISRSEHPQMLETVQPVVFAMKLGTNWQSPQNLTFTRIFIGFSHKSAFGKYIVPRPHVTRTGDWLGTRYPLS